MRYAGPGQAVTLKGATNQITLQAGETYTVPAGDVWYQLGPYTDLQQFDTITQSWRGIGGMRGGRGGIGYVLADGANYRLANQTGCAVGALITNGGSGYTSAPTVTASAGSSIWKAIVGGAVSTSVTVSSGGSGYTYPPAVIFSAPPTGGIPATGYSTLSSGAVSSITVTNQGAGYTSAPTITLINDPRESPNIPIAGSTVTYGTGASAVATLTGANTITGLLCLDHGTPLTALPTLSFSGGGGSSAAATVIMCWTITGTSTSTAGAGLSGTAAWVTAEDSFPSTAAAYTNPATQSNLVTIRKADIRAAIASNAISGTPVIYDGGIYTSSPIVLVMANASVVTTAPVLTATVGGAVDTSYLMY